MTRKDIQDKGIDEISNLYFNNNTIYIGEYGTGSGKTKILLESAKNILNKTDKSVIISTANNTLVSSIIKENNKHLVIEKDKIEIIIGAGQYIDIEVVKNEDFIKENNLKLEDILEWDEKENKKGLTENFIDKFNISYDYFDYISIDSKTLDKNSEFKLANRFKKIIEKPKIYITNHSFLLIAYSVLSYRIQNNENKLKKIQDEDNSTKKELNEINLDLEAQFTKIPLLLDEVHTLNDIASLLYSNRFALSMTKSYLNSIAVDPVVSKKDTIILRNISNIFNSLLTKFKLYDESKKDFFINELFVMYNKINIKELKQILKKISKKGKLSPPTLRRIVSLEKELDELEGVAKQEINSKYINIELSPNRKYPSFSILNKDPINQLRNFFFAKTNCFIAGISGTLKIGESNSLEDNIWSLERIGLLPYYNNSLYIPTDEQKRWNNRLSSSLIFIIKERIFSKQQAIHYIYNNPQLIPPKQVKKHEHNILSELKWIKNIAKSVNETAKDNTLVLMSSFNNCELLAKELLMHERINNNYNIIYSQLGKSLKITIAEYFKALEDKNKQTIIIGNLSFYTGVDLVSPITKKNTIKTIIVGKLPFQPINLYSKFRISNTSELYNMYMKAILVFRQGLGRGIRTFEDKLFIVICDPRINKTRYKRFIYFLDEMSVDFEKSCTKN